MTKLHKFYSSVEGKNCKTTCKDWSDSTFSNVLGRRYLLGCDVPPLNPLCTVCTCQIVLCNEQYAIVVQESENMKPDAQRQTINLKVCALYLIRAIVEFALKFPQCVSNNMCENFQHILHTSLVQFTCTQFIPACAIGTYILIGSKSLTTWPT